MNETIYLIANTDAGTTAITLDDIEGNLKSYEITYYLHKVSTTTEASDTIRKIDRNQYSTIAVFGGDSTVAAVAKACAAFGIPVLVLPGGSSNALAKFIHTPLDIKKALGSYAKKQFVVRSLPLAEANGEPLALDIHFGLFSNSQVKTSRALKSLIGDAAYYVSALRSIPTTEKKNYKLIIDGRSYILDGYACYVLNFGNLRILGASALPRYKPGLLRVLVVRRKSLLLGFYWFFLIIVTGRNHEKALFRKYGKEITVTAASKNMIFDDHQMEAKLPLTISTSSMNVNFIIPVIPRHPVARLFVWLQVAWYRYTDQIRRRVTGIPSERFSRISKNLYLGGQYGPKAISHFQERGITGIVSMRTFIPVSLTEDSKIEILHLPTVDMTAPSIENLKKGVEFIYKQTDKGGAAYVHCRLGEGRGPTMAAAYLISLGMTPEDAVAHLQQYRPFVRPNKKQVRRLQEFAAYWNA